MFAFNVPYNKCFSQMKRARLGWLHKCEKSREEISHLGQVQLARQLSVRRWNVWHHKISWGVCPPGNERLNFWRACVLDMSPTVYLLMTSTLVFHSCSSGTMVVDSVLKFSKAIDGARVVSILKEAAEQGRFDGLKVVSNSIIQISYTTTSLASTESPSPTGKIKDLLNDAIQRLLLENLRLLLMYVSAI